LCVVHAAAAAAAAMKGNFLQLSAKLYAIIYIYWASAGLRLYKNGKSKTKRGKKIYKKKEINIGPENAMPTTYTKGIT